MNTIMEINELMKPRYKVIADIKTGMYSVCDEGYIINNRTGKPIKPYINKKDKGYAYVKLQDPDCGFHKNQRSFHIGVLVGRAFVDNPENKPTVQHKDGNKLNNHYTNIGWATYKEQIDHAVKAGLIKSGSKSTSAKLNERQVEQVRAMFANKIPIFEIACDFRVSNTLISKIVNGKSYKTQNENKFISKAV